MSELKYLAAPSVDEKIIIATATSGRAVKTAILLNCSSRAFELVHRCVTVDRLTFDPFSIKYVNARTDDQHHSNSYIE